jgi:uncharacterized membrane protein YkoI
MQMRKAIVIGLGAAAAAVLAVSGVAAAMDDGASPSASPSVSGSPSDSGSPSTSAGVGNAAVSADQARAIATAAVPGGVVTEIDLRDGQWKVHLNAPDGRYEVLVDANTGAIVKLERSGGVPTASPSPTRGHDDGDHSGRGRGGDDNGGDDHSGSGHGGSGHGSDDGPGDDHGSDGHGSDD